MPGFEEKQNRRADTLSCSVKVMAFIIYNFDEMIKFVYNAIKSNEVLLANESKDNVLVYH